MMIQEENEGEEIDADSMVEYQKMVESLEVQKKEFKEIFGEDFATFSNMIEVEGDISTAGLDWNNLKSIETDEFKQELMEESTYNKAQEEFPSEENGYGLFEVTNPLERADLKMLDDHMIK